MRKGYIIAASIVAVSFIALIGGARQDSGGSGQWPVAGQDLRDAPKMKRILLPLVVAGLFLGRLAAAATIYVNVAGNPLTADGTSWRTAFVSLQNALDKAQPGDEIRVAQGTYLPSKIYSPNGVPGGASGQNTPSLQTFSLPNQVAIYGGFVGTENEPAQRNPDARPTILSGAGTSWHVVTAGNDVAKTGVQATLDGITIANGNAQGPASGNGLFAPFIYAHNSGGGLYVTFGSQISVNKVRFLNNAAGNEGGAIFSINSNLNATHSYFSGSFSGLEGGAVEVLNTFQGSTSYTATIASSVFDGNSTGVFGGAMVGEGTFPNSNSTVIIDRDTFRNNKAIEGGAIVFDSQASIVRNSRFDSNVASVNAGALATTNVVDTIANAVLFGPNQLFEKFTTSISNCVFSNNVAQGNQSIHDTFLGGLSAGFDWALGGGALVAYMNGYMRVTTSRFINNVAQNGDGGAILNGRSAGFDLLGTGVDAFTVNTTVSTSAFAGNQAPNGNGGAIASLPEFAFSIPERTVGSTMLSVTTSAFLGNSAGGDGGALYLNDSTATINRNAYNSNTAVLGNSIYGLDSIINGSSTSPYIQ